MSFIFLTESNRCAILIKEKKVETPVSHQSELVNIGIFAGALGFLWE